MAWNEPGGNGPRDPWRGGSDQGPPDLDEMLRKLKRQFGGGGAGRGGPNIPLSGGLVVAALIVVMAVTAFSGFYRVEEAEQAVVLRFGKYHETKNAGLRWNVPVVDSVLKANTQLISSHSHKAHMLTADQNIVDVRIEVQYLIRDPRNYFLEIRNPEEALHQATESALRHAVGGEVLNAVMTERRVEVVAIVKQRIQEHLDNYRSGIKVQEVNIQDAHPPQAVKLAFDDVIKAKEDKARFINEAEAYKNQVIPEALGKRERILAEANAYRQEVIDRSQGEVERFEKVLAEYQLAPEVTRQRLYLETMEQVFGSTTKVMMDLEGSNNVVYLPLDRMLTNMPAAPQPALGSSQTGSAGLSSVAENNTSAFSSSMRRQPVRESR